MSINAKQQLEHDIKRYKRLASQAHERQNQSAKAYFEGMLYNKEKELIKYNNRGLEIIN